MSLSDALLAETNMNSTAVGRALRIHSILSLGGTGTGVKFHSHTENWLAQVQGRKGWSLLPPASSGADMRSEWKEASGCALFGDGMMPKPPLQCIVESGEAIYVPTNWHHATCNLSPLTLSFGGQGDLGAFSGRQLIDAILDNDEAAALKLLKSRPKRLRQLLRARSKQGLSAVHVSRLDPASCLPAVDAPTCVCSRRWLSCTTASGRCAPSPWRGPTSPSRCSVWRRTTARCSPPPSGTPLTRSSLC
eukprot:COSAG04_NODE_966_length_9138_cov_6.958624_2_plen_248_part_00